MRLRSGSESDDVVAVSCGRFAPPVFSVVFFGVVPKTVYGGKKQVVVHDECHVCVCVCCFVLLKIMCFVRCGVSLEYRWV